MWAPLAWLSILMQAGVTLPIVLVAGVVNIAYRLLAVVVPSLQSTAILLRLPSSVSLLDPAMPS